MKGRNPTAAEKRHMAAVAALGCIVCLLHRNVFTPAGIHHTAGKTAPDAHKKVLPLCVLHHQGGQNTEEYVSRHPWKAEFERRYGTEEELLAKVNDLLGVAV